MQRYSLVVVSLVSILVAILAWLAISTSEQVGQLFEAVVPERTIEYVEPKFVNGTAIVTLSKDQRSGPIVVNSIHDKTVVVDFRGGFIYDRVETVSLGIGDNKGSCNGGATLLEVSSNTATFNITAGSYCPICYHVYNPHLYLTDDNLQALESN